MFPCQLLKAQPLLPQGWSECTQGQWLVPGPGCLLAAKRGPNGPPPCQVRLQMRKREFCEEGDEGRVQKQLGRILVGLLHRWGMSTLEGTLRGNGVEQSRLLGSPWVQ